LFGLVPAKVCSEQQCFHAFACTIRLGKLSGRMYNEVPSATASGGASAQLSVKTRSILSLAGFDQVFLYYRKE